MKSFRQDNEPKLNKQQLMELIVEAAFIAYQKDEHALDGAPQGLRNIVLHLSNDRDQLENHDGCGECELCRAVEIARSRLPKTVTLQ